MGTTVVSGGSYATVPSTTSYTYGSSYAGVASDAYADATYGSGSISSAYSDPTEVPFTSFSSVPSLGAGEKLCPVDCATPSLGGEKGRVLGCYAVCEERPVVTPVTTTVLTQVVRPVVYVRYPVPYGVAVPGPVYAHYSRYGDHGHAGGYAANCSYDYGYHGHAGYGGYGCR